MRVTLAVLALVGCAMAAVHQVQLTKIESQRTKMMRAGTWSRHIKMKNARRAALVQRAGGSAGGASVVPQKVSDSTSYSTPLSSDIQGERLRRRGIHWKHHHRNTGAAVPGEHSSVCLGPSYTSCSELSSEKERLRLFSTLAHPIYGFLTAPVARCTKAARIRIARDLVSYR